MTRWFNSGDDDKVDYAITLAPCHAALDAASSAELGLINFQIG